MNNEQLQKLSQPNLFNWLSRVVFDWLLILLCVCSVYVFFGESSLGWVVLPIAMVVIGTRQHALGILGHDGAHRLVCRNKWWNDLLTGLFCFWPMGFSIRGYRAFHFKHHQKVGTSDDPEVIHTRHRIIGQWKLPLYPLRLLRQLLFDLCGGSLPHLGMAAVLTKPVDLKDRIGPAVVISTAVGICWWFGFWWILALWFGCILTTFWISFRLRIWTEHTVEDENSDPTHRISASWWQRFLFLPHNTWCHWEHHLYPQIPCWNLPLVRELERGGPQTITLKQLISKLKGNV